MKKITKLLACISTITAMITGMINICSAEAAYYGSINNKKYLEYVSGFEISSYEDWLIETIGETHSLSSVLHAYDIRSGVAFEYGTETVRYIQYGFFGGMRISGENISVTQEELNAFLQSKGITNAEVSDFKIGTDENGNSINIFGIKRTDNVSTMDKSYYSAITDAYAVLGQQYGFTPLIILESMSKTFKEIKGDADGSGVLNVRDAALISNYLADGKEIPDNADLNQDGEVNVRDAAAIARNLAEK